MTVGELLAVTAVDIVSLPGPVRACADDLVVARARWLRPVSRDARLVLTVRPCADGTVVPFERRLAVEDAPRPGAVAG